MKFIGVHEDWRDRDDCVVIRGRPYNIVKTLYLFFIPVFTWGENHSHWMSHHD